MLRTKASVTTEELGDQYCMLGPYNDERVKLEVCMPLICIYLKKVHIGSSLVPEIFRLKFYSPTQHH